VTSSAPGAAGEPLPAGEKRWVRAVLHVDMDAFYVAVELLRRPELRGRPVVVGGAGRRGVVAAASYEARAYGVHSAMPSAVARRLCPQAIFLPGDHPRYAEVSRGVMEIFARVTPLVEPLSLDEAFLDVTGAQRRMGPPAVIAAEIRRLVADEQGLACSVGVATTKFVAKLASEAAKPSASPTGPVPGVGVQVVWPGRELEFLHPLPVTALWGVGPATLARLERLGVATVGALAALPEQAVAAGVGEAVGRHLWALSQGRDERDVVPDRSPKSVGHEETFAYDLVTREDCQRELIRLADAVAGRLRHDGYAGRTITLKLRFGDFRTMTRAKTLPSPVDSAPAVARAARALLAVEDISSGVRLLGVSVSGLTTTGIRQLSFDELLDDAGSRGASAARSSSDWEEAERAVDAIRSRFGDSAIGPGILATGSGVRTLRRGAQAWGPEGDSRR
jgi:DNA polymerase-4